MSSAPVFQVYDPHLASMADEPLLGLWEPRHADTPDVVSRSFGVPQQEHELPPVWRATLPANAYQAADNLARGEQRLHASRQALADAPARLDALVEVARANGGAGISFNAPTTPHQTVALSQAERELLGTLEQINTEPERMPRSFSTNLEPQQPRSVPEGWRDGVERVQSFLQHVRKVVAHYALIETVIADEVIGRTAIGWGGNAQTTWSTRIRSEQVALHWRTLDMSLESRRTFVNTFVIVSQGLLKIAVLVSAPGGVVLALPAVWKFINKLMAERQQ